MSDKIRILIVGCLDLGFEFLNFEVCRKRGIVVVSFVFVRVGGGVVYYGGFICIYIRLEEF